MIPNSVIYHDPFIIKNIADVARKGDDRCDAQAAGGPAQRGEGVDAEAPRSGRVGAHEEGGGVLAGGPGRHGAAASGPGVREATREPAAATRSGEGEPARPSDQGRPWNRNIPEFILNKLDWSFD